MEGTGEEQLREREVEHPDGVLHTDVLIAVTEAFHPAAVCAVADSAVAAWTAVVAAGAGVGSIAAGLYGAAIIGERETGCGEEIELLVSASDFLCSAPVVWMGEFGGNRKVAICEAMT